MTTQDFAKVQARLTVRQRAVQLLTIAIEGLILLMFLGMALAILSLLSV